ncbi:alternative ribosome rescue aminoacyl-tRNA hydrolase ArfB [Halomonas denitrificans]|nr:aminoacyl-tRNA hydrolase [Halomonas denitrificans]
MSVDAPRPRHLPPEDELEEKFIRASGPGGQHVNRSETAVQLRFDARASRFLTDPIRDRLIEAAGQLADQDGVITIRSESSRSQYRNRVEARRRLAAMIERASRPPKRRIKTRPSRAQREKRLSDKRHKQAIRRLRKPPQVDE